MEIQDLDEKTLANLDNIFDQYETEQLISVVDESSEHSSSSELLTPMEEA